MNNIWLLTKAEWYKLFKTKTPFVLFILITMIMGGVIFNEYNYIKEIDLLSQEDPDFANRYDWHTLEERTLEYGSQSLDDPYYSPFEKEQIRRRLEVAQYRLEHEIGRDMFKNGWWFFSNSMFDWIIRLIILFIVMAGVNNLAGEFQNKTINFWLTTPNRRWKILTSKYLAIVGLGILSFALVFLLAVIAGLALYGVEGLTVDVVLSSASGPYLIPYVVYALIILTFKFIELLFVISFSFMIAILLKSTGAATITAILTTFLIPTLVLFVSKYFTIFQWLPFNHVDFRKFIDFGRAMPEIEDVFTNTVHPNFPPFTAALIVISYMAIFVSISYYTFCKRDVH